MPKINVYLPDDLAEAVKAAELPVSAICQRALADALEDGATRTPTDAVIRRMVEEAGIAGLTRRSDDVLEFALGRSGEATSVDLLGGIVHEGGGLALMVLRGAGVEPAELAEAVAADQGGADSLVTCMTRAVASSVELGHNYVGTEHLLLGLVDGGEGEPVADELRRRGIDAASARASVRTALWVLTREKESSALSQMSGAVRTVLAEIRDRLDRLEA